MEKQARNLLARRRNSKAFWKILISTTVCTLTIAVVLSSLMAYSVRERITGQSIDMSNQTFRQIQNTIDNTTSLANALATQVLLDDACSEILLAVDQKAVNPMTIAKAAKQIDLYQSLNPYVESIYIYNRGLGHFLTTDVSSRYVQAEDFYDSQLGEILDHYSDYRSRTLIKRQVPEKFNNGYDGEKGVYTYFLDNMSGESQLSSAVIINISQEWLTESILSSGSMEMSQVLVMDDRKEPLVDIRNLPESLYEQLLPQISGLEASGDSYLEARVGGERYFVSFLPSEKSGWKYIKITDWNYVFRVLNDLRRDSMLLIGLILLLAAVVSLLGAGTIFRFYNTVESKYKRLLGYRRSNMDNLRDDFLYEFLNRSPLPTGDKELQAKLEEYDIHLDPGVKFSILTLQIGRYEQLKEMPHKGDIYSIKYGFRNIFEEIFCEKFTVTGMILKGNSLVFLISGNGTEDSRTEEVRDCFRRFCHQVKAFIDWDFQLVGVDRAVSFRELPVLWDTMRPCLEQTFFYPSNEYVDCQEIQARCGGKIDYHTLSDKKLTEALRSGNLDEAKAQYQAFTESIQGCSCFDYLNAITWLTFSAARVMGEYERTEEKPKSYFANLLVEITECEKAGEVDRLFLELLETACQTVEQANTKNGVSGKVSAIKEFIGENYRDPNLTLEQVSEHFGVSSNYLGRIFKKETDLSMAEYINTIRLEHIVDEFTHSDRSVKDIAADNGFLGTNYFYAYFKKRYGLTPQAYREKLREKL